jgi:hypothetical protein
MNTTKEKILLRQDRDFSENFNVSVKFLRENFKPLFSCLLLLAGPFVMLHSIMSAVYQSQLLTNLSLVSRGVFNNLNVYNWQYFVTLLLQFFSILAVMSVTYAFMLVYKEKGPGEVTVSDVAKKIGSKFGSLIGGLFLYLFLAIIFIVTIVVMISIFGQISPILAALIAVLVFIAFLILLPNIMWQFSSAFLVILYEDEPPYSAYGRTRQVMKDNYWWTWLYMVCITIILMIMAWIISAPSIVINMIHMFSRTAPEGGMSIFITILTALTAFLTTIINGILYLFCGMHYFSLAEKKDGKGLMERINEIGQSPSENGNPTI